MTSVTASPPGAAGMAAAQTRMAAIRSRIASLSATGVPVSDRPAPSPAPAVPPDVTASRGATVSLAGGSASLAGATPASALPVAERLPQQGRPWAAAIERAAADAGVDPALLAAVVKTESNFDPAARSHAGAIGLGQLMPGTAAALGVDPHDPHQNLAGAARYLREQLDRFGSTDLALAAYNAGPNRVAQAGGVPRIPETLAYVERVLASWEQMR